MNDIFQREDLIEIYKNPMNFGSISNPTVSVNELNPMCGDNLFLDLVISENIITQAKFRGDACSVSLISAALLTEYIIGKDLNFVKNISKETILSLIQIELTTSRIKCATLILEALKSALKKYTNEN